MSGEAKQVTVYTDGACIGNPGPGGFAAVLVHGPHRRELAGGYRRTTNNRMELMAVIASLRALKYRCRVTVHSDSRYVVDGVMSGSMRRRRAAGWQRGGSRVPNADLWEQLLGLCERHEVTLCWVRGHAGEPENERCDQLSNQAAAAADLPADEGYEQPALAACAGPPSLFDGLEATTSAQPSR